MASHSFSRRAPSVVATAPDDFRCAPTGTCRHAPETRRRTCSQRSLRPKSSPSLRRRISPAENGRALRTIGLALSVHGLRRTFNNLSRQQVAGNIVTRAITGHVTEEMTEHYSHVDRAEKLCAADQVVALTGLRVPANDNSAPTAPESGGSSGRLNGREVSLALQAAANLASSFVRSGRIELPQACAHQNLNLNRTEKHR